jgi:hypothetical protein
MVSIGQKLLPVIQSMVGWMLKNKTVTVDVLAGIAALAAALALYAVGAKTAAMVTGLWEAAQVGLRLVLGMTATELNALTVAEQLQALGAKMAAAAQWLWNVAMDPIGLLVLAVAALVGILVLMATHLHETAHIFDVVRHAAATAFDDVRHAIAKAFDWVKSHWPLLLAILIGPVGLATLFIIDHFGQIRHWIAHTFDDIRHDIASAWDLIRHDIAAKLDSVRHDIAHWGDDVLNWFRSLPGRIVGALGNLGGLLLSAGHSIISGLISGIENAVPGLHSALSWVSSLIPSWKGPLDKDAVMLRPHGQAIMAGLIAGLQSKLPDLKTQLAGTTAAIASGMPHGGLAGAGGYGAAGGRMEVTLRFDNGSNSELGRAILNSLRGEVRVVGGGGTNSVQRALGQTS